MLDIRRRTGILFVAVTLAQIVLVSAQVQSKAGVPVLESVTFGAVVVLGYLLGHYLNIYIYQVLLNAKASEQSARMVSMKNATDSAESLIAELRLAYNKLRQGNITKELLEIAGGQAE